MMKKLIEAGSRVLAIIPIGMLVAMVIPSPAWSAGIVAPGETLTFTESDAGEGTPTFNGNP